MTQHSRPEADAGYCEGHKFMKMGSAASPEVAVMVNDTTNATNILQVSGESAAFTAGAAGTTGTICLDKAPVFDAVGAQIGCEADTSFAWVTGTILTTEVAWDYRKTDAEQIALMANGEYRVDYRTGKILYKKATADVADTCNYKTRQTNVEVTVGSTLSLGSMKIEDGTTAANKADVNDANTARTTGTHVIAVQNVDAEGHVPDWSDLEDTRAFLEGLSRAEDAQHVSGEKGIQALAVRKDAAGTLGDTDGDYVPLQVDANGALRITGSVSAATEFSEDDLHVSGDKGIQMLGVQKSANGALADDGDYASIQISQHGYVKTTMNAIRDAAVAIGSGAMDGGTQRVNLATDDPAVALLGTIDADTGTISTNSGTIAGDTTSIDNKTPALGTAAMAASSPATIATDDTQFGSVGAAADADGNIHGQLRYIGEYVDNIPEVGAALMAASLPVTLATDDTHYGAVGAASDADGVIHGQLRYIGEAVDALPTALGAAAMAASMPVTLATDDTHFGAVGAGGDAAGTVHEQLRYIADGIDLLDATLYKVVATGAGAIALTSAAAHIWELNSITVHLSAAPTTSEFLTFTLDSTDGAAYDTMLFKCDPSAVVGTDFVFTPDTPLLLASGDEIVVSFTNTDGVTYGVRIVGKKIG